MSGDYLSIVTQFGLNDFANQMVQEFVYKLEYHNAQDLPILECNVFWDDMCYKNKRIGWYGWLEVDISKPEYKHIVTNLTDESRMWSTLDIGVSVDKPANGLYETYGYKNLRETLGDAFAEVVYERTVKLLGIVNEEHQLD